jgi:hypothetical protein
LIFPNELRDRVFCRILDVEVKRPGIEKPRGLGTIAAGGHYIRKFQYGNLAEDLNLPALTEALRQAIAAQEWKSSANHEKVKFHI